MKHNTKMNSCCFISYPHLEGLSDLVQLGTDLFIMGEPGDIPWNWSSHDRWRNDIAENSTIFQRRSVSNGQVYQKNTNKRKMRGGEGKLLHVRFMWASCEQVIQLSVAKSIDCLPSSPSHGLLCYQNPNSIPLAIVPVLVGRGAT